MKDAVMTYLYWSQIFIFVVVNLYLVLWREIAKSWKKEAAKQEGAPNFVENITQSELTLKYINLMLRHSKYFTSLVSIISTILYLRYGK